MNCSNKIFGVTIDLENLAFASGLFHGRVSPPLEATATGQHRPLH